jgi:hypothetical protein
LRESTSRYLKSLLQHQSLPKPHCTYFSSAKRSLY